MTRPRIDFFFDVVCPYAYLAHTQIDALADKYDAELQWRPVLLGGLFRVIGAGDGPMPSMSASKAKMNLLDMQRWADHYEVPLNMPSSHPNRTVLAMRTVLASGDIPRAARALYQAYWVDSRDVSDPKVVASTLDHAGFDGQSLIDASQDRSIKERLRTCTDEAAELGAFGVPSYLVTVPGREPELFWGQDRSLFVEKRLQQAQTAP